MQADRLGFRRRHVKNQTTGFTDIISSTAGPENSTSIPSHLVQVPREYKDAIDQVNYIAENVKDEEVRGQVCMKKTYTYSTTIDNLDQ